MVFRSSVSVGSVLSGFAAQVFYTRYKMATTEMDLWVRLNGLVHNYSALSAKMPEMHGITEIELKDGEIPLGQLLNKINEKRIEARKKYKAIFEDENAYSEEENDFALLLDEILLLEDEITARINLIDSQRMRMDTVPTADE